MEMINIDKFHPNTSILLKEDFLKELRSRISSNDKLVLKQNYNGFRNLSKMLTLCAKYGIPLEKLGISIISYRTTRGRVTIVKPKLPIIVTPIFDMLIAHAIGDGFCSHLENRIPAFAYRQSRKEILDLFIEKLENVFGSMIYKEKYFYNQKNIYTPSILSHLLYSHYSMKPKDFLENNSKIPERILNKNDEHLIAVLIAFILDEGNVDSSNICIGLHNKKLINDIKTICDNLNYKNVLTSTKNQNNLYILSEGVKKFWKDYNKLKQKYPEVSLAYKEKAIENFILRKNKIWRTARQGETPNKIIELLKESNKTIKELSTILQLSRQGVRWHLKQLEKTKIVKRIGTGYARSDIYELIKYVVLPVKNRGRSRQYGIANDAIIDILKKSSMTTKEIANAINVTRETTWRFMTNLEKLGKVRRTGKKIHKTHPSIMWSIHTD